MRRIRASGNFFLCLLLNIILNPEWTIPAWILLLCHFFLNCSIRWFFLALGIYLLVIILQMVLMGLAVRLGTTPDKPKENKNPYSVKKTAFPPNSDNDNN